MKKFSIYIISAFISIASFAQIKATVYGDPNDPNTIKQKNALEAKGFLVQVKPEREKDTDTGSGDNAFISRWTGKKLPNLAVTDMNGNPVIMEDLEGKIVHINFWSVTCKPCIEEFPELNQLKEKYNERVVFLAIAPESQTKVNKVLKKHSLDYRSISDASDLFEEMGIEGYPKNVFVNKDGIIEKIIDGTHYTIAMEKGEPKMVPDNFKYYDEVLANMTNSEL